MGEEERKTMQFPTLIVSDLHLTDNPGHEYRWGLFPWLHERLKEEKVKTLLILGDMCDQKDHHSAELVNRMAKEMNALRKMVPRIVILMGNHDFLKAGHMYFKFLEMLPGVEVITKPMEDPDLNGPLTFYLPYSKNPARDWAGFDFSHYAYLFMHQTVKGAISSNGQAMEGEELPALNAGKVYSGDIHVPQIIGSVEYAGSPYHVHFGDKFKPRCILLDHGGKAIDLHFKTISRVTVKVKSLAALKRLDFKPLDQVKLRIELSEADKHDWSKIKRDGVAWLKEQGAVVQGVELIVVKSTRRLLTGSNADVLACSPSDTVTRFVELEELGGEALDIALDLIGG